MSAQTLIRCPSRLVPVVALAAALAAPSAVHAEVSVVDQFGSFGAAAGDLSSPRDAATDTDGNVYVTDRDNNRISVFSASGQFLRAWGKDVIPGGSNEFEVCTTSCKAGEDDTAASGELSAPEGIDVVGSNVYVTDFANNRVQQYTTAGAFVRMWGKDVSATQAGSGFEVCSNTTPGDCQAGEVGGAEGELNLPLGIDVHSGHVYVADINNRVSEYLSTGPFVRAWGKNVVPGNPTGFEVCNNITDCQAAETGSAAGEFSSPHGVATRGSVADGSARVYVADRTNSRIQEFTSTGGFVRTWGKDVAVTGGTGFEVCTAPANCKIGQLGGGRGELSFPTGIGVEGDRIFVGDNDNERVDEFTLGASFVRAWGKDVIPGGGTGFEVCTTSCQEGSAGSGPGEFDTPRGVVSDEGKVYVAELENDRIQAFRNLPDPPLPPDGGTPPSNEFEIGKVKGKKLKVTVPGPGEIEVRDAADGGSGGAATAKRKKHLKPATATATAAGAISVALKLTKPAKRKLKSKGKLKVNSRVTFTPAGGTANTLSSKLKLKRKKG